MKKVIICVLALAMMVGVMSAPMIASATTVNDVYNYFLTMPMADQYKDDVQKLMAVVPCTDAQAEQLMGYAEQINEIADAAKGNDPRNYTSEEVQTVLNLVKDAGKVVNVEVNVAWKADGSAISSVDEVVLEFIYEGQKIYEYDSDAVSKTGSDISSVALFGGFALLTAAAVAAIVAKKKVTE